MRSSTKKRRVLAALHLPRTVAAVVAFADSVVKAMKNSRHFPHPTPSLDVVRKAIDELRRARVQALLLTRGAVEARDEKLATVGGLLALVRAHVQAVADRDPTRARAVIRSAGLGVRKEP